MSMISKCGKDYVYRIYSEPSERVICNENIINGILSIGEYISNTVSNIAKKIFDVFNIELDFFKSIESKNIYSTVSHILKIKNNVLHITKIINFISFQNLVAYVPEGFSVKYVEGIKKYLEVLTYLENNLIKNMLDFNTQIGYIINSKVKSDISNIVNKTHRNIMANSKIKDNLIKDVSKLFSNKTTTETTIGKVIKNNGEWEEIIKHTEQLGTRLSKFSLKDIKDLMNTTNELLASLVKVIKENETSHLEVKEIKQIAEASYVIASELEFFVATSYDIIALIRAISDTMDVVVDIRNRY